MRAEDTNFNRWARPYLQDLPDNYGTSSDPYLRMLRRRVRLNRNVRHLQTLKKRINERARRIKPKLERWATHVVRLTTSNEQWRRQIFQTIYKNRLWG